MADGIKDIQEKLVPRSRVDDLEDEVKFLKLMCRQMAERRRFAEKGELNIRYSRTVPVLGAVLFYLSGGHTMSINEMESKARELRELQALIDEATAEAEALKDALKAAMGDAEEVRAGAYKITWKAVTSARIDTGALRKALPDVAAAFTKESTVRRFCVA